MPQPAIFAHLRARRAAPENTLPAFETALTMGGTASSWTFT